MPLSRSASADTTSDQAKLKQIGAQLAQLDQQNSQLDDDLLAAQQDAQQAQADVVATQAQIADMQQRLGVVQQHVSELALQTFSSGDSSGGLGALLGDPSKLTSTVERDQYTRLAFSDGQDSIDELGAGVDELNKQQAKLVKQQQVADRKSALVTAKQTDLANKTAALQQLKAQTQAQYGQDQVDEVEAAQQLALQEAQAAQAAKAAKAAKSSGSSSGGASSAGGSASGAGGTSPTKTTSPASGGTTGDPAKGTGAPSSGGSSSGASGGGHPAPPPAAGAGGAVAAALSQLGVPYRYASATPGVAFDCSGLTSWAWGQAGKSIPHQSAQQFASLPHVSQADVQPGDLLFFYSPISHVAMYIGGGQFVDAPNTGHTVRTAAVNWGSVVGIARP